MSESEVARISAADGEATRSPAESAEWSFGEPVQRLRTSPFVVGLLATTRATLAAHMPPPRGCAREEGG